MLYGIQKKPVHYNVIDYLQGLTITDVIMNPWNESQEAEFQLPRVSIHRFLTAMTDQDPILGKNMIDGAFSWIKHTRGYRSIPGNVFESLRDYLDYRSIDIGTEYASNHHDRSY